MKHCPMKTRSNNNLSIIGIVLTALHVFIHNSSSSSSSSSSSGSIYLYTIENYSRADVVVL